MATLGLGQQCLVLSAPAIANTTPVVSTPTWLQHARAVSFQLETGEDTPRSFAPVVADNVVASTHTWVFANGAFTADNVGGTLTITGAANSNNNGSFTIASVTNSTTIVTGGTQTNETFTVFAAMTATVTDNTVDGTWKIEVSNDLSGAGNSAAGQAPTTGTWTDVTSGFKQLDDSTAIATVAHGTAATKNQYVQPASGAPLSARAVRVTFTPTGGKGSAKVLIGGGEF